MKYLPKAFKTITITIALSLGWPQLAQAITITTDGTWSNPLGRAANVAGEGTNTLSWGIPVDGLKSSYDFVGNGGIFLNDDALDGSAFKLGTFTHNNFPITAGTLLGATLNLNLSLDNGIVLDQDFTFNFAHNETNNFPPCNPVGTTFCPDIVSIPDVTAKENIKIGGRIYRLEILGFSDTIDGSKVNEFITEERSSNQTMLFASLNAVNNTSVPEPSSFIGLFTLAGVGIASVVQKQRKNN